MSEDFNIIRPSEIFATPKDMASLMQWVEAHNGSERSVAAVAAGMAWNLASKVLADHQAQMMIANELVDQHRQEAFDLAETQVV